MNDTVENGIRMRGRGELGKPIGYGELRSQEERGAAETIIHDFEQITSFCRGNGIAQPVIEDEQVAFHQGLEEGGVGAIQVGQGELRQEAGGAEIANGVIGAAGRQAEGATEVGFSCASWASDQQVEMVVNPMALGQFEDRAAVEAASGREIEVFEGGRQGKARLFHLSVEAAILTPGIFEIHQQSQAFFKSELGILGIGELLLETFAESGQAQLDQFVE
jgi:hypothetical protein